MTNIYLNKILTSVKILQSHIYLEDNLWGITGHLYKNVEFLQLGLRQDN